MLKFLYRLIRVKLFRIIILYCKNYALFYNSYLIIAPHPDDEVLGCSGLIQTLLSQGKKVYVVFMTHGESSHKGCCNIDLKELAVARETLTFKSTNLLGLSQERIYHLSYPDGSIKYDNKETEKLRELIGQIKPDVIFVPHSGEGWNDHIETQNIARRVIGNNNISLYAYCVWFWYYNVWNINWKNAFVIRMNKMQHKIKNQAIDEYIKPLAACGKPYSGVLPKVFVWANRWNKELFFRIK